LNFEAVFRFFLLKDAECVRWLESREAISMGLLGILQILWEVFDKSSTFKEFIDKLISSEKTALFTQIGDTHWAAAREHLSNMHYNDDISKDEVLLAIGALEQSYQLYMQARPKGWRILPSIELFFLWNTIRLEECYLSACAVSLLQSRCYKYLNAQERVIKYAERATERFEDYADLHLQVESNRSDTMLATRTFAFTYAEAIHVRIDAERKIKAQRAVLQKIIEYLCNEQGQPSEDENDMSDSETAIPQLPSPAPTNHPWLPLPSV
jgi:hypothetical protein